MSNEILIVPAVHGAPGNRWVKCPHCKEHVSLPDGPIRGEQFQHRIVRLNGPDVGCMGWFEVPHYPVMVPE